MYKKMSYSQDFLGDEDMQVMNCYPENYLLFILDPTASLSNESLILPLNSYLKLIFFKTFFDLLSKTPRYFHQNYYYYAIQSILKTLCDNICDTAELNIHMCRVAGTSTGRRPSLILFLWAANSRISDHGRIDCIRHSPGLLVGQRISKR